MFNAVRVPANQNPRFTYCNFSGTVYIDQPNNVVFENCNFTESQIVTGVPSSFIWTDNALYFKGNTTITNTLHPECTIMAPNFNVNIGDFKRNDTASNSVISGILIGGIVDLRDNVEIQGTILSMANLDNITASIYYYGTNVGYWEEDAEESGGTCPTTYHIKITPQPTNPLPLGVKKKYTIAANPQTVTLLDTSGS